MKRITMCFFSAVLILSLTACSNGNGLVDFIEMLNEPESTTESSATSSDISTSSEPDSSVSVSVSTSSSTTVSEKPVEQSEYDKPEENNTPAEIIKTDYYKYYDPITNRSTVIDSEEYDEAALYMIDDDDRLKIITPFSSNSCQTIQEVKRDHPDCCFVLDNYVFFEYGGYHSTVGLKKYDIKTGEISVVVPSNSLTNTGVATSIDMGNFVLSNNNKIYGSMLTWEKEPYTTDEGKMDIRTISRYNIIEVNDSYDGYRIVGELDEEYEYRLRSVYDNIAYLSKKEPDTFEYTWEIQGYGTISGEELGFYSYNIDKGVEEKLFNAYKDSGSAWSDYRVIEMDGEPCFIYNYEEYSYEHGEESHIKIYTAKNGWKEIFYCTNRLQYNGGVQYLNGKLYILLCPDDEYYNSLCYEVTMNSNKYIGICEDDSPIVISSSSGKIKYVDSHGNVKDFL